MIDGVVDILKRIDLIKDIEEVNHSNKYENKVYEKVIKFKLNTKEKTVGIVMAIPTNWKRNLIDFFIEEYMEFAFIPHMGSRGLMCLFDLEGVLIKYDFEALINEGICRLNKTITDGIEGSNRIDFITEFDSYWLQLQDIQLTNSFVNLDKDIKKIKYLTQKKSLQKEVIVSISDKEEIFNITGSKGTIKNGIYINIQAEEYVYPPDWREKLDINYINKLLQLGQLNNQVVNRLIGEFNRELLLFININQPNGIKTPVGILIKSHKGNLINYNNKYLQFNSECKCIPLYIDRSDSEYLISRGGIFTDIKGKKVLIVGCGSIGGYLTSELIKSGISNLTLVDNDKLTAGNIYRHLLGLEYIGQYKTKAISKHIEKNIPFIKINTFEDKIEDLIENYMLDFEEFDLIISATGNHNMNRWINEYLEYNNITTPVVYLWNEVLGIGNHAAFIDNRNKGCFECLIGEDENGIYDRTSYCERGQIFTKKYNGCTSTFLPFGSVHSLKTVSLGVELSLKYFNRELKENLLISQKGDDTYIIKENLFTSERYKKQKNGTWILSGNNFLNKKCSICSKGEEI